MNEKTKISSPLAAHEIVLDVLMADQHNLECGGVDLKATSTYLAIRNVVIGNVAELEAGMCAAIGNCGRAAIESGFSGNDRGTFMGLASSSNGHVTCVSFLLKTAPENKENAPLLAQFCSIDSPSHVMTSPTSYHSYEMTTTEAIYYRHLGVIGCLKKSTVTGEFLTNKTGLDALAKAVCSASEMGHLEIVTRLAEFACTDHVPSIAPFYFVQAMVIAVDKGHLPIVELFHDTFHVPLDSLDERGRCALNVASANGHRPIVDYIVEAGSFDINAEERYRLSVPLLLAAKNGHDDVIRILLDAGADVESRDPEGFTALMLAAQGGHKHVITLLLERGAQLKARNVNGWTPLMFAVFHRVPFETVKLLFDEKDVDFNVNARTRDGNNLLILASLSGQAEVVKYLLENGADIFAANDSGTTALMEASKNGHEEIVKLLKSGAKNGQHIFGDYLNQRDNDGFTALMMAASRGDERITSYLIQNGANVNLANKVGSTALVRAVEKSQAGTAKVLIEAGANVNFRTSTRWTPLMIAAQHDNLAEVVKLLIEKGADINAVDDDGFSALSIASYRGNVGVARVLLDLGADVTICDKFGNNCLILAARGGYAALTECLLSKKDVLELINKPDCDGRTALKYANLRNFKNVSRILARYGAVDGD